MSRMNIFNLLFRVLMHKVSFKKDAVFWVVAVCSSSRNLPKCQINLLPPSSTSVVEAAGCSKVLLNFPCPKWQHFLQQVFFVVSAMRTSSLTSSIQFNSIDSFKWCIWDFKFSHGCLKCYKSSGMYVCVGSWIITSLLEDAVTPCSEAASSKCWLLGLRESLALQRISCVCFVLCVCLLLSLFVSQFMWTCTYVHIQGGECVGGGGGERKYFLDCYLSLFLLEDC